MREPAITMSGQSSIAVSTPSASWGDQRPRAGADAPHAFWAVCGVLGALGLLQAALLRRLRWW
jgi:hypothetical protein